MFIVFRPFSHSTSNNRAAVTSPLYSFQSYYPVGLATNSVSGVVKNTDKPRHLLVSWFPSVPAGHYYLYCACATTIIFYYRARSRLYIYVPLFGHFENKNFRRIQYNADRVPDKMRIFNIIHYGPRLRCGRFDRVRVSRKRGMGATCSETPAVDPSPTAHGPVFIIK